LTFGHSPAIEVYYCSSKARRILEDVVSKKEELTGNYARAFMAGKLDGDSYVNDVKREMYIGYSINNIFEAGRDAKILENLGIEYKLAMSYNVVKLRTRKPRSVAEILYPFVLHSVKRTQVITLNSRMTPTRGLSERDPCPQLLPWPLGWGHTGGTAAV